MRVFAAIGGTALAMVAALWVGLAAMPAAASPPAAPAGSPGANPFDRLVPLVQVGDDMPGTRFIDQRGALVTFADLRGDAVAVTFVYTRCRDECPIITRKFGAVRALLGDGPFRLVEVTIDPTHDTPPAIAAYAREFGIGAPAWRIVTGQPDAVDDFDRRMDVHAIASGSDQILHDDSVVLVAPTGEVADVIEGSSWTPADLAAQLRHIEGDRSSWTSRLDLALGAALAYCGGAIAGRAGIGDLIATIAILAAGVALFLWVIRRTSGA